MKTLESLALTVCAALIVGVIGFFQGRAGMVEQAEADKLRAKADGLQISLNQATTRAKQERDLRTIERESFTTYQQEQDRAHQAADRLIADLRTDNRRLRVPVRVPACPATVPGGSAAPGAGEEGHAELTADAGAFLVSLLQRGDDAIRKHAAVVDSYDRLAAACGKPLTPEADHASP